MCCGCAARLTDCKWQMEAAVRLLRAGRKGRDAAPLVVVRDRADSFDGGQLVREVRLLLHQQVAEGHC